ncbi:MAG: hypothetical protein JSV24_02800, partial [Bacteroidales bacterium]
MKIKTTFCVLWAILLPTVYLYSQAPQGFNYQAVARDDSGEILAGTTLDVKIGLLAGTASGTLVWEEEHSVTTNEFGLFTLVIGDPSATRIAGTAAFFSDIEWGSDSHYLRVDIDTGSGFQEMGTAKLMSVPYSMFAENAMDIDDADADPENEIQDLQLVDDTLTITGNPSPSKIDLSVYLDNADSWTVENDTTISYMGHVGIGTTLPGGKLEVMGDGMEADDDPLFEVKRKDGQTVFAVYPEGVRIYVEESATKGTKGGFAVGGFSPLKGITNEFLRVTPDSVRIYVNDDDLKGTKAGFAVGGFSPVKGYTNEYFRVSPDSVRVYVDSSSVKGTKGGFAVGGIVENKGADTEFLRVTHDSVRIYVDGDPAKGTKGGFAVGGFSPLKGSADEYLRVTSDSVRIYIPEESSKGTKGGFAVGGFSSLKGITNDYLNVSGMGIAEILDPSEARVLWYPKKEAFLTGRVLIESPDSVGTNSMATGFESKAIGNYSQAMGYQAIARGENSTAIGINAKATDMSSFAFGDHAEATAFGSYAIGSIGRDWNGNPTGKNTVASGSCAIAIGLGANAIEYGAFAFGIDVVSSSYASLATGHETVASGYFSTAMGRKTTASGENSVALGYWTTASRWGSTAMGELTKANGDWSTAMGNWTEASGDFSTAMGVESTASGNASTAMNKSTASGTYSTSMGIYTNAKGTSSTAMGSYTNAIGNASTAIGANTTANGQYSLSAGAFTNANGNGSASMGYFTRAEGNYSVASGLYTVALPYLSVVIGRYNDTVPASSLTTWVETDPLFIIGNGTNNSNRHNAVMVKKNGEVYLPNVYDHVVGLTNRDLFIDNTGKIGYVSSSLRNKMGVTAMEDIGWLYRLHPVNFIYKDDIAKTKQYGLIAEEVEQVNPLFVSYSKQGEVET